MHKAWQLIQALEEGKVLSKTTKGQKEFILFEKGKLIHHSVNERLPKTSTPFEEIVRHPERWEIISVQKFEKLFSQS